MTVWTKLQSWLGASASDVAIDNEFNNIYLGLNEAANGNLPSGYNKVELTFTAASLTVKGETKMGNTNVPLASTLTVSGAAGWRYIVTTNGGVMSVESIPPAEITADTQVYTPTPVFNVSANGYYSTVNTARRIVGICYFDATNIIEAIPYSSSKRRNDDIWLSSYNGSLVGLIVTMRMQYTAPFALIRGDAITIVDNGAGSASGNGVNISTSKNGLLSLLFTFSYNNLTFAGSFIVKLLKNDVEYFLIAGDATLVGGDQRNGFANTTIQDIPVNAGDFFSVVVTQASGSYYGSIDQIQATFKEY